MPRSIVCFTGHRSAICRMRVRCSSDSGPFSSMIRSRRRGPDFRRFAVDAVLDVCRRVAKPHDDALERPLLSIRVHANRHGRARCYCHEHVLVRCRSGATPSYAHRLVSDEVEARYLEVGSKAGAVAAGNDPPGEFVDAGFSRGGVSGGVDNGLRGCEEAYGRRANVKGGGGRGKRGTANSKAGRWSLVLVAGRTSGSTIVIPRSVATRDLACGSRGRPRVSTHKIPHLPASRAPGSG